MLICFGQNYWFKKRDCYSTNFAAQSCQDFFCPKQIHFSLHLKKSSVEVVFLERKQNTIRNTHSDQFYNSIICNSYSDIKTRPKKSRLNTIITPGLDLFCRNHFPTRMPYCVFESFDSIQSETVVFSLCRDPETDIVLLYCISKFILIYIYIYMVYFFCEFFCCCPDILKLPEFSLKPLEFLFSKVLQISADWLPSRIH